MAFYQYLKISKVIELQSEDKVGAVRELTQVLCKSLRIRSVKPIITRILKREESASTFIGHGIAIPHTRGAIKDDFAIVIGRSSKGVNFDAARGALARIIVMVIANEEETDYSKQINLLSEIAYCMKSDVVREQLLDADGPVNAEEILSSFMSASSRDKAIRTDGKLSDAILAQAASLAKDIKAAAVLVFADAVRENDFLDKLKLRQSLVVITSNKTRFDPEEKRVKAVIQAPSFLSSRMGQLKIGVLLALSRNMIDKDDKIVCISGNAKNGEFDTVVVLDIAKEYQFFLTATQSILPPDVKPEVLERILGLAGEIAVEGREGKPLGTIFVVGDTNTVNTFVRQLVINPFRGYSESERNIMDPGLDETIKEFSAIDGAFIITGDGIVLSAGSYLRPASTEADALPSGLGARHAAAAAITACSNALAIAVSESTGNVTVFKSGAIMMALSKPVVGGKSALARVM